MRFFLKDLKEKSKHRPQGYYEEVLESSEEIGDGYYELDEKSFELIATKYRPPSKLGMLKDVGQALIDLKDKGMDLRSKEDGEVISKICERCPYFIEADTRCGACGCYLKFKVVMKSWHCPKKKW